MKYKVNSDNKLDLVNVYDNEYLESCLMQLEKILYKNYNKIKQKWQKKVHCKWLALNISQSFLRRCGVL